MDIRLLPLMCRLMAMVDVAYITDEMVVQAGSNQVKTWVADPV